MDRSSCAGLLHTLWLYLLFMCGAPAVAGDTICVYCSNGGVDIYPVPYFQRLQLTGGRVLIYVRNGQQFSYEMSEVDSVSTQVPVLPRLLSFGFETQCNTHLFSDVEARIEGDSVVGATIGAVGRWLTPTFALSDPQAIVHYNGRDLVSRSSRHSFSRTADYAVGIPAQRILYPSNPETPAMQYAFQNYVRHYAVRVRWLTDEAQQVPRVDINIENGRMPRDRTTYLRAFISIDGAGVFPSMQDTVRIRGRGNSSWTQTQKKPYRLRFATRHRLLGMPPGKNWVLLANFRTGSLLANAIGMKASQLMGAAAANHIVPVELYMNGEYRGSYMLTGKLGFSENGIDIEDDTMAALLELDSNYDGTYKFYSSSYDLPVNIMSPNFDEEQLSPLTFDLIRDEFNAFTDAVRKDEPLEQHLDIRAAASYMALNEFINNYELMHPKSTYVYNEHLGEQRPWIFGPTWDLDYTFGYDTNQTYFQVGTTDNYFYKHRVGAYLFWRRLRQYEAIDRATYRLWTEFLQDGGLQELQDFCDEYYSYARPSLEHNLTMWPDSTDYAASIACAKLWLQQRAEHIYSHLNTYPLDEEDPGEETDIETTVPTIEPLTVDVYSLQGYRVKTSASPTRWHEGLPSGIYLVNGRKILLRAS